MTETEEFQCESCQLTNLDVKDSKVDEQVEHPSKLVLYSTGCPKCHVVEMKLAKANVNFDIISDVDAIVTFGKAHGIASAPILDTGTEVLDFTGAVNYIRGLN